MQNARSFLQDKEEHRADSDRLPGSYRAFHLALTVDGLRLRTVKMDDSNATPHLMNGPSQIHPRHILHADLDAFYTSVEQRDNPQLRGRPVVVGGSPEGRGVVAAASYEARAFGVRSAMPMGRALWLCSQAVRVSPRFSRYQEVSDQVMAIFRGLTSLVEPLSLDEAYLDVTAAVLQGAAPVALAQGIKEGVQREVGLTISVGVASSKAVAKIASGLEKPDGLVAVAPGREAEFLDPLPVGKMWGIGPKAQERLAAEGVHTIGQLAARDEVWFQRIFGRPGGQLRRMALGLDPREVTPERPTKSVSAEVTLPQDTGEVAPLKGLLERLVARVEERLAAEELQGRTVTLKLRTSDFRTFTRSTTLSPVARSRAALGQVAWDLLRGELRPGLRFRLVGVGVSNFAEVKQLPLFG